MFWFVFIGTQCRISTVKKPRIKCWHADDSYGRGDVCMLSLLPEFLYYTSWTWEAKKEDTPIHVSSHGIK